MRYFLIFYQKVVIFDFGLIDFIRLALNRFFHILYLKPKFLTMYSNLFFLSR
jgi:hypothetical protein